MSDIAIRVENLGKQYQIGGPQKKYYSLRESISETVGKVGKILSGNGKWRTEKETIWAVKDVSFEVKHGEVIGIIGRNGAGKTTLLKILSRITEPTEGRVELYGRVGSLLEVGTGFHPELTGRENIYLSGAVLGMKRAEIDRKFDEIVDFSEIEKFLDTPVKRFSSGMYIRLAFGVAAHMEPEILLVDEVLAVGDAQFQKKCLGKMSDVAKEGRTVLFVSHNMVAIKSLCNKAIWLEKGSIAEKGDVDHVVSRYLQDGRTGVLERKWDNNSDAPGNEKVRLLFARILPLKETDTKILTVETPLQIEFVIWNNMPNALLHFTIHLFTIEGIYVLADGSEAKPRKKGLVKGVVNIPPNFLNDGTYSINLQIVRDRSKGVYWHNNILVFEIQDSIRSGKWYGKWPGVIRPKFEWFTENIDEKKVNNEVRY